MQGSAASPYPQRALGRYPRDRLEPPIESLLLGELWLSQRAAVLSGERAGWVREGQAALLRVDLGDVLDADQEPCSTEQAGADFDCLGFVCRFSVADAGDAADPFGRGLEEKALATTEPIGAVMLDRVGSLASLSDCDSTSSG
jgi:hypothetical protein